MEVSLFSFSSSKHPLFSSLPQQSLTLNPGSSPIFDPRPRRRAAAFLPPIRASISRTRKEEIVDAVKKHLDGCHLVAGIHYQGFTANQFQDLRRSLPETVSLLVAKNTLVGKALEGTPWAALAPCMKGMNAWMFVHTEVILDAIKPYRSFQQEMRLENNDFAGAVFEGRFYPPEEFNALETMPSRAEVYAEMLGVLQGPAISVVGTLQAPARDLVLTLKAFVKKMEEQQIAGAV